MAQSCAKSSTHWKVQLEIFLQSPHCANTYTQVYGAFVRKIKCTLKGTIRDFFTISSLRQHVRSSLWRIRAQNQCNTSGAHHMLCRVPRGTNGIVCLLVGCLMSQQQARVSQGRICSDNFTCCHTEIQVAYQTFYLTQSQYTDTGPTSPSADPITPGAWQGSHWSANF